MGMLDDIRNTHKRVSDRQREERDMYERGEINPLQKYKIDHRYQAFKKIKKFL